MTKESEVDFFPIEIYRGADWEQTWEILNEAGERMPIAGWGARLDIVDPQSNAVLVSLTIGNGKITIVDDVFVARLPDEETRAISQSGGWYDFLATDLDGHTEPLTYGPVKFTGRRR